MAELLTVVGGIASFAQIIGIVFQTSEVVVSFCSAVKDAPAELCRVKEKLLSLRTSLESIQVQLDGIDDDDLLPPDMCYILHNAVRSIYEDVTTLNKKCVKSLDGEPRAIGKRLKWAFVERHLMSGMLERLRDSESTLTCVLQLLNFRLSLLIYASQKEVFKGRSQIEFDQRLTNNPRVSQYRHHQESKIGIDSWLRKFGLYGSFSLVSGTKNTEWKSRVRICFKPPRWILSKSIAIDLQFARAELLGDGIHFLPGSICLQNQVPLTSPLMSACASGDIKLIKQHLVVGTGQLGDRAICCGKTPLLLKLAIEGQHLNAIQFLLESGADPNVGSDSQILPIFAAAGMSLDKTKHYAHLPPRWDSWLKAFDLLVKHGASVHEINGGKTLSMLNINSPFLEHQTMPYFQILLSEGYMYWESVSWGAWSAMSIAIRTKNNALQALKFLVKNGLDMNRVFANGQSPLHLAAEIADDVAVLEYLCTQGCLDDLNRQDAWGWTPLHYAIMGAHLWRDPDIEKVRFLLLKGANINIKGRPRDAFGFLLDKLPADGFTPGQMCRVLNKALYERFERDVKMVGASLEDESL
ncbi:hypothetical protein N7540_000459 [Penicillium herquei]|nr:hypothetical protein N7540_000459 [Penicillium herquei]